MFTRRWAGICQHRGVVHRVYLVGGPARVGTSSLAHRLMRGDGIAWLPTDVLRTVLRRVLPELDDLDQGDVSAAEVGELMYPPCTPPPTNASPRPAAWPCSGAS